MLTLTPETETRLRTVAAERGMAPEQALETLLARALENAEKEADAERQDTLTGLRQSAEEFAQGRWTTPDDLDAALRARRA